MPKLKQPTPLQNMAMDVLFTFYTSLCNKCSAEGSLDTFRECIAFMKKDICPYIPWQSAPEFYDNFLNVILEVLQFWPPQEFNCLTKSAYEIIMDRKITGLKCVNGILGLLDPRDAHRIHGLKELEIPEASETLEYTLEYFRLEDLTSLTFLSKCADADLTTIARNCPKLELLDVRGSQKVTDEGLRALSQCPELRDVCVSRCTRLSRDGINEFLFSHNKMNKLSAWGETDDVGFDCFSHSDSLVHHTINEFTIVSDRVSNDHLHTVVKKFPNLTSLKISGQLIGDLSLLKNLNKLSQLDFGSTERLTWNNLKELLTFIGGNISYLNVCTVTSNESARGYVTQNELNFLFKFCENIEYLKFIYQPPFVIRELVVPPFKKLKVLENYIPDEYAWLMAKVEFCQLLELEELKVHRFHLTAVILQSMILDAKRFPNLKLIQLSDVSCNYEIDQLREIVRSNNLDLRVEDED